MVTSMNRSPKLKLNRWDALVAAVVLALSLALGAAFWTPTAARSGGLTVVVSVDGVEVDRAALPDYSRGSPHVYEGGGYAVTVQAHDGVVDVTESTCPNHDCQRTPPIKRAGQSIVCLPARVVVALENAYGSDAGFDAIAG